MKPRILPVLLAIAPFFEIYAQCKIYTFPYGQVQTDINRGYKMIPTKDGHFVIAGQWNGEAYLMKVDAQGQALVLKKYGSAIGGQSLLQDVAEAPDGGFVAVGECTNCVVPNDSLTKVIALKTDASLNLDMSIGVKKFGAVTLPGGLVTNGAQINPHLVQTGDGYLLSTGLVVGASLNWEDVLLTRLSGDLTALEWKNYHTGYFESAAAIVSTGDGFILPVNRAFVPEAALLKIDKNLGQQWVKTFATDLVRGASYLPGDDDLVLIGDRAQQALLMRFNATTGTAQDSLLFGDNLSDFGYDVHPLPNGELLAGVVTDRPNLFGTYATSRVYRVGVKPLSVNCYYGIPNPDNLTNMSLRSILPLSPNGKDFAVTGIRGFYNRTFFHSRRDCEATSLTVKLCSGKTYTLPNGQIVGAAGTYNTTLVAANGCDSVVQTNLSYYPAIPPTEVAVSLCPGESHVLPNGQTVSDSGTYEVNLPSVNGCDSLVRTVIENLEGAPTVIFDVILCAGGYFVLPNGDSVSMAGDYLFPYTGPNGCEGLQIFGVSFFPPITVGNADIQVDNGQGSGSIALSGVSGGSGSGYQYLWSNGATTPAVQNLPFGAYTVTVTSSGGCSQTFSYIVQLVAWNDLSENVAFRLSPNPFSDRLRATLESGNVDAANFELQLFDAWGRCCKAFSFGRSGEQVLDTGDLPAGVYFLQLMEKERVVARQRVVKNGL